MTHVDGGGLPEGTQLNGIYEIEKRIAIGGMGEVYIGRVIQTGDKVAIKMILPEHAGNATVVDLFRREASTLHNLYHEAIVRYFVFSVDPVLNRPYLSMEYADGPPLADRLRAGPLSEKELAVLRRRVAGGLYAAHQLGIVHRDISPDNIILVGGHVEKAKIIDFGIAKSQANEGTLIGSGFAGKLNYVSPEQLGLAGGEVSPKSDIYSLGLVFAQAATGRPLPMGGSHAEVIDKRRVVPPLDDVPPFIRPLIEAMVQPDPAARPADMQAVAEWEHAGSRQGAARAAPVHPRERRRQQEGEAGGERRRPWLWIGLGGGALAAAAVASVLLVGEEQPGPSAVPDGSPELAATAEAPTATVGQAYDWRLPPFDLPSGSVGLTLRVRGTLPPGLAVAPDEGGTARIGGTPTHPGAYDFDVLASTASGKSAFHEVRLTVRDAQGDAARPAAEPARPAPGHAAGPAAAPAEGASTPASSEAALPEPGAGSAEPVVATGGPGDLAQPPGGDGDIVAGASDASPTMPPADAPALGTQSGAGGLPRIPAGEDVPVPGLADPAAAVAPAALAELATSGDGAGVAASQDASIPVTGRPQRPSGGAPAGAGGTAAIPALQNQPPTLREPLGGRIDLVQGRQVNERLGVFEDEEGAASLRLDLHGTLPQGVDLRLAQGGIVQLYGTPVEYGEFDLRIAAVDDQDLISRPITVTLEVEPPAEMRSMRDYILGYDGGDCFLSRPTELGPRLARIEVFAAQSRVQPVLDFDAAFKRDMGFEAQIGMRPVSEAQCPLVQRLDGLGPGALDDALAIQIDRDEPAAGETLSGSIRSGEGARLYLVDDTGALSDLSGAVHSEEGRTTFALPATGSGPHVLIAAKPRPGASLPPSGGLDDLFAAVGRGDAVLALGFFLAKG